MDDHVIYEEPEGFTSDKSHRTTLGRVVNRRNSGISSNFVCQYHNGIMWKDSTNMLYNEDLMEHALYSAVCELAKIKNGSDWANPYHLREPLIGENIIF